MASTTFADYLARLVGGMLREETQAYMEFARLFGPILRKGFLDAKLPERDAEAQADKAVAAIAEKFAGGEIVDADALGLAVQAALQGPTIAK